MKNIAIKDYFKPTPVRMRAFGDALLGVSATIVGFSIAEDVKWLSYTALAIGVLGKFLTNFFKESNENSDSTLTD